MASYCSNCGSPVTGAFCIQCGKPVQTAGQSQPPAPQAAAVKAGGGSAVKIILIVVGVLFVCGALAVGGLVYVGYRAKQKITQMASEYGLDAGSSAKSARRAQLIPSTPPAGSGCPFLPWQEASQILGLAFERVASEHAADGSDTCEFFITPQERQRVAKSQIASALGQIRRAADANNEKEGTKGNERLVEGSLNVFQSLAGGTNRDAALRLEVLRQGGQSKWATVESVQSGVQSQSGGLGMQPVQGLGDKAYMLPGGFSVTVLKGDAWFTVIFSYVPGPDEATAVAQQVARRL